MQSYYVILYYHYAFIEDLETYREQHLKFCVDHELLGRVYIAKEGINGTLSGLKHQVESYMEYLKNDPRFEGIVFKIDEEMNMHFTKCM